MRCKHRPGGRWAPRGNIGDDLSWSFFDYGSYNIQIECNGKKFYVTLKYFKLIGFTFKFRLCITYLIKLMPPNLGVALYIIGKLLPKYYIGDDCLVLRSGVLKSGTHKVCRLHL